MQSRPVKDLDVIAVDFKILCKDRFDLMGIHGQLVEAFYLYYTAVLAVSLQRCICQQKVCVVLCTHV